MSRRSVDVPMPALFDARSRSLRRVPVASMHLQGVSGAGVGRAFAAMATGRLSLSRVDGLRFWKLLGTGSGRTFTVRDADPRTWGLFAVWDDEQALDRFLTRSPLARSWDRADERWDAVLAPTAWKGRWSGRDPFDGVVASNAVEGRPVAALTRARVRAAQWRRFAEAVPPVAAAVNATPGLAYTVGIGEAPIGLQGTFSLWDSEASLRAFAYGSPAHRAVMERTRRDDWYAEELFARFTVLRSAGTIGGRER